MDKEGKEGSVGGKTIGLKSVLHKWFPIKQSDVEEITVKKCGDYFTTSIKLTPSAYMDFGFDTTTFAFSNMDDVVTTMRYFYHKKA